jgi:filamentous hemagglutinin family protein
MPRQFSRIAPSTSTAPMKQHLRLAFWHTASIAPLSVYFLTFSISPGLAQVVPDETLGAERSRVNAINALNDRIDGGALRGSNLFHSFQRFDIEAGRSVYFNDRGASNIFSRVTGGGLPSSINGTLGAYGTANLFFINPNGITFGSGARLAVGGSFVATTANSLIFDKGSVFSASNPAAPPLLTIDTQVPIGLQFEGKPNSIIVNGVGGPQNTESYLSVLPSNNLRLVGGNIEIFGKGRNSDIVTLQAPNGKILLGSIAEAGTVKLINDGGLELPDSLKRGDISLTNGALLKTENQGTTYLYADGINLKETSQISGNLSIDAIGEVKIEGNSKLKNNRQFSLDAKSLLIREINENDVVFGNAKINVVNNVSLEKAQIVGDNITLKSGTLALTKASKINTGKSGSSDIGNILLQVQGHILLEGESSFFTGVPPDNQGNAGSITIIANSLEVLGNSQINSSQSQDGKAGDISLQVRKEISFGGESKIVSSVSKNAKGSGGTIIIKSDSLDIKGESKFNASLSGKGSAGDIDIQVHKITLDEKAEILASVNVGGDGTTGNIDIKTDSLKVYNAAQIVNANSGTNPKKSGTITIVSQGEVDLLNGGGIRASVFENAQSLSGGNIDIIARSVSVKDGSQIETNISGTSQNASNSISIKATDSIIIDGYNKAFNTGLLTDVQKGGLGNAAEISVNVPNLILRNNAKISASTSSGNGGNVYLNNIRLLLLRNNSKISTTAGLNQLSGNGGNISIDANKGFIVAVPSENSDIAANAFVGAGGKVEIKARAIFGIVPRSRTDLVNYIKAKTGITPEDQYINPNILSTSDITAISQQNPILNGQVVVNAAINPNQGLNQVPKEPRSTVVADSCQVSNGKESVRFFDIGRGGLPPRPEDPLSIDLLEWASPSEGKASPLDETNRIKRPSSDRAFHTFQSSTATLRLLPPCQSH